MAALAVLLVAFSSGCDSDSIDPAAPDAGPEIVMLPVVLEEWQRRLDAMKPDIVVVDMWATWCTSCLERFPHMVELNRRYRDQGVRFVSLNLDDPDDTDALVFATDFLVRNNARFEHFRIDENLMLAFERLNLIAIPAVVIYNRDGSEAFRLTGDDPNNQFDDEDVETAVVSLLRQVSAR